MERYSLGQDSGMDVASILDKGKSHTVSTLTGTLLRVHLALLVFYLALGRSMFLSYCILTALDLKDNKHIARIIIINFV